MSPDEDFDVVMRASEPGRPTCRRLNRRRTSAALLRCLIGRQSESFWCRSDGERQFIEGRRQPSVGWLVGGDLVLAASDVLDERVTGGKDPS